MAVYRIGEKTPQLHDSVWVAEEATVIGWVTLGARASVWAGAVVRGDHALRSDLGTISDAVETWLSTLLDAR